MKKKIVNFLKVPGRQKILENLLSLGFVKVVTMLLPLIIIPHLIKTIGLELIGLLAIVTAICAYLNTVIDYGFAYTGTREVAKNNFNKVKNTQLLIDITTCKLFLSFLSFFLIFLTSFFVEFIEKNILLILLSLLNIVILSLCPSWFFQGLEDMKKIAIGEVIGKIISFLLIILIVKNESDIYLVPTFYLIGQIFSLTVYLFFLSNYIDLSQARITGFNNIYLKLNKDWNMFINILFPNFYNIYSYLILGFFGTLLHVGIYDVARKVLNVSEQVLGIISKVYFPVLAKNINKFQEFLKVMIVSSIALFILQYLFTLYGASYIFDNNLDSAKQLMYIQMLAPFIYALMISYGINYLGVLGEDKILRNITIITSIIGFIAVTVLTYFYMAVGALVGVMLTWFIRFVFCYLSSKDFLISKA
ncbi:flippase [Acinetobacter sp. ANC 4779]|uniref:oligosaccharide flippase family protein n=1 Tax=Acinetobacter sp. ANC 4779 TaxID=2529848 RepID=UPI00103D2816|nr:oligosaccharide flippase family protein [Acinetobacter sp. ANC 4779]TCB49202.1 flippase [Acinetobacter sp. ANC 4779]